MDKRRQPLLTSNLHIHHSGARAEQEERLAARQHVFERATDEVLSVGRGGQDAKMFIGDGEHAFVFRSGAAHRFFDEHARLLCRLGLGRVDCHACGQRIRRQREHGPCVAFDVVAPGEEREKPCCRQHQKKDDDQNRNGTAQIGSMARRRS